MRSIVSCVMLYVAAVPTMVWAELPTLGRLFYTPQERQILNQGKALGALPVAPEPQVLAIWIDGYVNRTSSRSTLWLNGRAVPFGVQYGQVTAIGVDPTNNQVRLHWYGQLLQGKPGQQINAVAIP
ncbi:hypothetical protein [Chitinivorax sp. B]|uniref:hypothetical protein n=1 Tax=Chitinivorax sp. B TaxID=2502235 RepID=UPI0010F6FF6E|nr:hypothetical protein [Chitinivorax sp. B]